MRLRLVFAALALVFFFLPIGLRAVGVTARPFENRPLATFPKPSQGWSALDQGTQFLVDRLPLREQAVRANAWASERIFKAPPVNSQTARKGALPFEQGVADPSADQPAGTAEPAQGQPGVTVLPGKDGWLHLEDELGRACNPFIAWPEAMRRWQRMTEIIRASGRRVVLVVAPDKSTLYPETLPDSYAERDCAPKGHDAAWAAIEGASDPAVLGLRKPLRDARTATRDPLYFRKDTHWNTAGATIGVRALLAHLGGPTLPDREIVRATTTYTGDLTNLSGAPEEDTSAAWSIRRPGLPAAVDSEQRWEPGGLGRRLRRGPGGPPMLEGRTLFVSDSFGVAMQDALSAYTRSLSVLLWYGGQAPAATIAAIEQADTVILETAERDLNFKASDGGIVTPAFLDELQRALRAR